MSRFNLFTNCKKAAIASHGQCITDADEIEKSRSVSFYEEDEDWDDDDDDDDE